MRDATDAAVGSASAHVTVSAAGPVKWAVAFNCEDQIPLAPGHPYSATFWARASVPRRITVAAGPTAARTIPITTDWRRYQVMLVTQTANTAGLQFLLAESAGDVWLDDVHFQAGVTNLYRRDFQNGFVLVNPTDAQRELALGGTYERLIPSGGGAMGDGSLPPPMMTTEEPGILPDRPAEEGTRITDQQFQKGQSPGDPHRGGWESIRCMHFPRWQ